jgi:hypothetical protein
MRFDFEPAHDAPTVQLLFMVTQLLHMKARLVGKVALNQELTSKIVVPRERTIIARRATVLRYCVVCMSHSLPL